jgi:hypothetical protein
VETFTFGDSTTPNATQIDGTNIKLFAPVTASGDISASGTIISNEINTIGHITASGNISASNQIKAKHLIIPQTGAGSIAGAGISFGTPSSDVGHIYDDGTFLLLGYNDSDKVKIHDTGTIVDISGDLKVSSHITASGNISSSGGESTFGQVVNLVGEDPRLRLKAVGANHPGIEWHEDSTRKWVLFNDPANDHLTFKNASDTELMELDQDGHLYVTRKIIHLGDADTFIDFTTDDINFQAGGQNMIDLTSGSQSEITFNEAGIDIDFRVEGDADTDLFFTNAGTDRVGVGTNSPGSKLEVDGDITSTNITASGDISASGTVFADSFQSATGGSGIDFNDSLDLTGNITASGDISASGTVLANTGSFNNLISATHLTVGNNISASGNFHTLGGVVNTDEVRSITQTTNKLILEDDQTLATNMVSLMSVNFVNIISDGNNNGTGKVRILDGNYDVDSATEVAEFSPEGIDLNAPITASGDISASGNISATGNLDIDGTSNFADDITIAENKAIFFDSTDTFIKANTGNPEDLVISADEDIILAPDDNIQIEHGATTYAEFLGDERELRITGNVSSSGFISTESHITASGNISSSLDSTGSLGMVFANGKIGVNTLSPLSPLHVDEGDIRIDTAENGTQALRFSDRGSTKAQLQYKDNGETLNILTGGSTNAIEITNTQNVKFSGPITGSGNISASLGSTGSFGLLQLEGDDFTSASLASAIAGGGGAVDSIANGADNRVVTFSDSDSLNGEANLTFDGSLLGVTGTVSASNGLIVDNNISASGHITASKVNAGTQLRFDEPATAQGHGMVFPVSSLSSSKVSAIQWDFPNDDAFIYAHQSSSDNMKMVFECRDNVVTDEFVFWFNNFAGSGSDAFPLAMRGDRFVVNNIYDKSTTYHRDPPAINMKSNNVDFYLLKSGSTSVSANNSLIFGDVSDSEVTFNGNVSSSGHVSASNVDATNGGTGSFGSMVVTDKVQGNLTIDGILFATRKSFLINTPDGGKLEYGALEGQQNDVFFRGELKGDNVIHLPKEWEWLVDENTITVQLTSIGKHQELFVKEIKDNKIFIDINGMFKTKENIHCYHIIHATRKDVELIRNLR